MTLDLEQLLVLFSCQLSDGADMSVKCPTASEHLQLSACVSVATHVKVLHRVSEVLQHLLRQ